MDSKVFRKAVLSVALVGLIAGAGAGGYEFRLARAAAREQAPQPATPAVATSAAAALPDFSGIVQRYGPAVVNVSTTATVKNDAVVTPFGQLDPQDPMAQFFRHFGVPQQPSGPMVARGLGSGFIVKADGLILTNAHVVDGATEVKVKLTDKREFPAKVVGIDKTTDVAVLKIQAKDLPTVNVGDPSMTKVGEWVLAIGSPFGFENSATAGIVSGRSRSLPDAGYVQFLQTDVAVNPGNSGGPLFDTRGQVIGINSQILSQSGGYMGLSFAIPIDVAMTVEQQLVAHGKVVRGRLGVAIQDVEPVAGRVVRTGEADGRARQLGREGRPRRSTLKPGDVILALDGKAIGSSSELPPMVAGLKPGADARLEVWRDHGRRTMDVKVGESKDTTVAGDHPSGEHGRLGLAVRSLTPQEKRQAGLDRRTARPASRGTGGTGRSTAG